MVNINAIRAESRHNKISQIMTSISKAISEGSEVDYEKLIKVVCFEQRVSRRTAREYIDIALSQIGCAVTKDKKIEKIKI